ncbi:MAG: ankyrin repeat domain-containing protein, partial [Cytophagales bacterium]|nr:ankyrin repeat domain-containing protein [Cytophagales bacterium]
PYTILDIRGVGDKDREINEAHQDGRTLLHWAAASGQKEVVKDLIEKDAQIDATNQYGSTPLHWAAANGQKEVVEYLIEKNAKIDATNKDDWTPLHWAAENGHQEVVGYLLEKGAAIEATDGDGMTPLHWAAFSGHQEVVGYLLKKGAAIEATDSAGKTPLHWAAANGQKEVVDYLIDKGAQIDAKDNNGQTPLHIATLNGRQVAVDLLEKGTEINAHGGWTPLQVAAYYGHKEVVEYLIGEGANINATGWIGRTALHWAAIYGHKEVLKYLIKETEIDVNAEDELGRTALHFIIQRNKKDIVSKDIQYIVFSLARHAAREGHKEAIKAFLTIKPNEVYKLDSMLLLLGKAVQHDQREIIHLLMEVIDGKDALRKIAQKKDAGALDSKVFKALLKQDVLPDEDIEDMLEVSIIKGSEEIIGHILEKCGNRNILWYDSKIKLTKDSTQRNKEEVLGILETYQFLYDSESNYYEPAYVENGNFQKILYNDQTILHLAAKTNKKIWPLFWKANPGAFGARNREGKSPLSLIQNNYTWAVLWTIRGVKYPWRIMRDHGVFAILVGGGVVVCHVGRLFNHLWPEGDQPIHTQPIYFNQSIDVDHN